MSTPVLATKLYIPPPRQKAVSRPRLVERLNAGLRHTPGILLISASAGSGKTTLVSEWVDSLKPSKKNSAVDRKSKTRIQVAWLSLDEGDNDPTRFLIYLVSALQTVLPDIGMELLAALQSPQPPPLETILTALLNEISTFPDDFILILDDYHVIESKPVEQALTFLMEHLPLRMHLVIATREDPQLPLARYRARGQLTELRVTDLRFTPAEAAEFLDQVMGLHLSTDDITALENRTEGWIAGLQLAALAMLAMQGQKDTAGFIKSFTGSHRFVLDYLMEEVLQRQPETIQTFLLTTSILERLCASLCEAVLCTPSGSGQETLNYLESANLFIVPLDNERHWYRYHRLFADLLQQRLLQNKGEDVAVYHVRASAWFEENGFENEAFQHAVAAEDFERAARLAELSWMAMFRSNIQNTTFLAWMKALPDELIRARPVLSVGYAWALLDVGEMDAAEARLQDAERWLETTESKPSGEMTVVDEEAFRSLASTISFARAFLSLAFGDVASTLKHARQGLASLPEADHFQRASAAALLGAAFWRSGELETACNYMTEGVAEIYKAGNPDFAITGIVGLADIRMTQGRLCEAVRLYERTLQTTLEHGEPWLQGTADLYLGLGMLSIERNDLDTAEQHLHKCEELGAQAGLPDCKYRLSIVQAKVNEIQGTPDGALDFLQ
ncbi:MAG TPA: AAA family ATPase, partial [Anaerolineales bacterium]|nr:AAA family ATPase [Anaerolineales bacterium]